MTKPIAAIPMSDPSGTLFSHLRTITPFLKTIFARVFVSVNAATCQAQPNHIAWLETDDFFHITSHQGNPVIGEDFLTLYQDSAAHCRPDQVLHLCFIDRVAFALQTDHRDAFIADMQAVNVEHTPLIFQRSSAAWNTHPQNYRELEGWVTRAGELLFGKTLDFAWCHLVVQARQLMKIIPHVQNRDMSVLAELILLLQDEMQTKDVHWLAWEDPFILGRAPRALKAEREQSEQETRKRLSYVIPMLQRLTSVNNDVPTI